MTIDRKDMIINELNEQIAMLQRRCLSLSIEMQSMRAAEAARSTQPPQRRPRKTSKPSPSAPVAIPDTAV